MINCNIIYNIPCLKCNIVKQEMVKIGAIYMCQECFEYEFGTIPEFESESAHSKIYYRWLNILRKRVGLADLGIEDK